MVVLYVIGFILLGGVVILAAAFGLPYVIAKSNEHNQATCECPNCRDRRIRASEKRHGYPEEPKPKHNSDNRLNTIELQPNMIVVAKGHRYRVIDKTDVDEGYMVRLFNTGTRLPSTVFIPLSSALARIWSRGSRRE